MLREIYSTHQSHQPKSKRRFIDSNMELFVWFKNHIPVCFQLSYNKCQQEYSINWHMNTGLSHNLIKPEYHHIKYRISLFNPSERMLDTASAASEFLRASEDIDATLADFIFARLLESPNQLEKHSNLALVSTNR